MKKTLTQKLFLLAVVTLFVAQVSKAQTGCNYVFSRTVNGNQITFNNTPNVPPVIVNTIIWTINTTQFANTNDPIYTVSSPGIYIVCMTVIDIACINSPIIFCDTVTVTGIGTIGIDEKELANSVKMFPNPSSGKVNLISTLVNVETIAVYNTLGEIVFEEKNPELKNELDLQFLPNGIYFVKTKTGAGIVTKKLTINK